MPIVIEIVLGITDALIDIIAEAFHRRRHVPVSGRIVNGLEVDPSGTFMYPNSPRFMPGEYELKQFEYDHGPATATAIYTLRGKLLRYECQDERLNKPGVDVRESRGGQPRREHEDTDSIQLPDCHHVWDASPQKPSGYYKLPPNALTAHTTHFYTTKCS